MALFNPTLGEISGKIAGNCFSHNTYGAYIRQKVTPVNPQTPHQQAVRNRLGSIAGYWQFSLLDGSRQAWSDYALNHPVINRFGKSIVLSGLAMFQKINTLLLMAGDAVIDDPPTSEEQPGAIQSVTPNVAHTGPAVSIAYVDNLEPSHLKYFVYVAYPVSPARVFVANQFKFLYATAASPTSPIDAHTQFVARFGSPVAGSTVWIRLRSFCEDSAKQGVAFDAKATVGA